MSKGWMQKVGACSVIALLGAVGLFAGNALAHGGDISKIHGCVNNTSGTLRVVGENDTCRAGESPLDWSKEGVPGPQGEQGPEGPAGATGPAGVSGPTSLYFTSSDYDTHDSITRFISLDLPAGTYLVTGRLQMNSSAYGGCSLVSGPQGYETYWNSGNWDNGAYQTLILVVDKITLTETTNVALRCGNGFGEPWHANGTSLSAIPVTTPS